MFAVDSPSNHSLSSRHNCTEQFLITDKVSDVRQCEIIDHLDLFYEAGFCTERVPFWPICGEFKFWIGNSIRKYTKQLRNEENCLGIFMISTHH